ncbi:hypothetical protein LguiB_013426 [Lonicera macranthoides]
MKDSQASALMWLKGGNEGWWLVCRKTITVIQDTRLIEVTLGRSSKAHALGLGASLSAILTTMGAPRDYKKFSLPEFKVRLAPLFQNRR